MWGDAMRNHEVVIPMPRMCVGISVLLISAGLALASGCQRDSATRMAQQISASQGSTAAPQPPTGAPAAPPPGGAPAQPPPAGGQGKGEVVESTEVVVTNLEVKAPYAEFNGAGRYSVKLSVVAKEPVKPAVWRIVAYGEDGKEVGHQDQHLVIPNNKPRSLTLDDFYCSSRPVKLAFLLTNLQAVKPPPPHAGGPGAGGGSGGAAPGPGGPGAGAGPSGPGGAPPKSGATSGGTGGGGGGMGEPGG